MVIVAECNEAEGLQRSICHTSCWGQHLSHAADRTRLRLECDFDKVTLTEGLCQAQQAASHGDSLEFTFGALSIFQMDDSEDRITEFDPRSTPLRVRLGEVGHSHRHYVTVRKDRTDY